ncbi:MAG TPA: PIG-L family deacetylase [Thermoanaerobaculia bacterium]|jgi:LmbE family N-acetylglucosaminyl deacetylase|nr:PIG-L family deacetylase [Thermoanaerobaculia bacterium]
MNPAIAVVKLRPHYRRDGGEVRFLLSRHPTLRLATEEIALFDAIDGRATVAGLAALHPGAGEVLARWQAAEVVEIVSPAAPPPGPPLVVVEPHMDDVALSAGGRLLRRRGRQPIVLLAATRHSNVSCYWMLGRDFFAAGPVTALRVAESELVADLAGASFRSLDRADAPLRFQPAERWRPDSFLRLHDALAPFLGFPPQPGEVRRLADALAEAVLPLDPAELWIPLGAGGHVDHRLTRDACLRMIAEHWDRFAALPVLLYEDHPYSGYFPGQAERIVRAFAARGVRLEPETEDVTAVFGAKLRLVSVYGSQFKARAMEPALRRRAEEAGGGAGRLAERAFRLADRPVPVPESELAPDVEELRRIREALARWLPRRYEARRVTVVCGAAVGRWAESARILLAAFPQAAVRVLIGEEQLWETAAFRHPRLRVKEVRRGGWPAALLAAAPRVGTPTIVVRFPPWPLADRWREQILKTPMPPRRRALHRGIAALLPLRPRVFCRHLGDACALLAEELGIDAGEPETSPSPPDARPGGREAEG